MKRDVLFGSGPLRVGLDWNEAPTIYFNNPFDLVAQFTALIVGSLRIVPRVFRFRFPTMFPKGSLLRRPDLSPSSAAAFRGTGRFTAFHFVVTFGLR